MRPREGSFSTIPLNLDRSEVDKFNKNFGKGRLSEIVREFIKDENIRIEAEKKVMPPTKGALVNYINNKPNKPSQQATLDVFAKETEIYSFIKDCGNDQRNKIFETIKTINFQESKKRLRS